MALRSIPEGHPGPQMHDNLTGIQSGQSNSLELIRESPASVVPAPCAPSFEPQVRQAQMTLSLHSKGGNHGGATMTLVSGQTSGPTGKAVVRCAVCAYALCEKRFACPGSGSRHLCQCHHGPAPDRVRWTEKEILKKIQRKEEDTERAVRQNRV